MDRLPTDQKDSAQAEQRHQDPLAELLPVESQDPTSADRLIEEIKREARIGPGQFRLLTVFLATFLLSLLFAAPRLIGMGYGQFFFLLYAVCYAFAPFVAWDVVMLWRAIPRRYGLAAGALIVLLIALPMVAWVAWDGGMAGTVELEMGTCCLWGGQVLCIAAVGRWQRRRRGFADVLADRVEARRRGDVKDRLSRR